MALAKPCIIHYLAPMKKYDGIALLSGGLDSILAIRLITEQGLSVLGLHFVSPFFGKPDEARFWGEWLGIDVELVDVGPALSAIITGNPAHSFGSVLNPCVDCKITMMQAARTYLEKHDAQFIISGEVLGQRPMSQRRDSLNVISRDGAVRDYLLRPLCAQHMTPTKAEESGLVDRSRLKGFSGRGRKDQMTLAKEMQLPRVPSPAGGCMLTEKENARRYWPLVEASRRGIAITDNDFHLTNVGRQLWQNGYWLSIGRNKDDNARFESLARPGDIFFKTIGFPGPLALGRLIGAEAENSHNMPFLWPEDILEQAAALVASYSPKACRAHEEGNTIKMRVWTKTEENTLQAGQPNSLPDSLADNLVTRKDNSHEQAGQHLLSVIPGRQSHFSEPLWETAHTELIAMRHTPAKAE